MTILDQLADHARARVAAAKTKISLEEIKQQALAMPKGDFAFENALKKPGISFICECKKASPSKGLIAPDFPYLQIAKEHFRPDRTEMVFRQRCISERDRKRRQHPLSAEGLYGG